MDDEAPAADPAPDPDGERPDPEGPDNEGPGAEGRARVSDLGPLASALRQARRPVLLLGAQAVAHTAAIRDAVAGRGIPVLHTYRARGIVPDAGAEAGGLVTGGTMEWPLLAHADLIVGLGVDEAEMIPAPWDYAAPTVLVSEWRAERTGLARRLARPGTHRPGTHRRYQLLHRRHRPDGPAARGDRSARGLDPGPRAALGARRRPGRPGRGRTRAGRDRPRRSRHAGPAAGGHAGAGAHPTGHDRHRGRGRAHAGGDATVGSGPAAPAAHLQRPLPTGGPWPPNSRPRAAMSPRRWRPGSSGSSRSAVTC